MRNKRLWISIFGVIAFSNSAALANDRSPASLTTGYELRSTFSRGRIPASIEVQSTHHLVSFPSFSSEVVARYVGNLQSGVTLQSSGLFRAKNAISRPSFLGTQSLPTIRWEP